MSWMIKCVDSYSKLCFAVIVLFTIYCVFMQPFIGLSNNGDFQRFSLKFGVDFPFNVWDLSDTEHRNMAMFQRVFNGYIIVDAWNTGYFTTYELIGWISRAVCAVLSKTGLYDIRYIGGVSVLFVLVSTYSIFITIKKYSIVSRMLIIAALLLLLTDPFYIQYYDSFFTEQSFFCYGLMFVAAYLRHCQSHSRLSLFVEVTALALLVFSKTQNFAVIIPGFAALILQQYLVLGKNAKRKIIAVSILFVLECGILTAIKAYPVDARIHDPKVVTYNTVMGRLLKVCDDPSAHLIAMGFDGDQVENIKGNIGNVAFVNSFAGDNPEIYKKLSSIRTEFGMFVREPSLVFKAMKDMQDSLYKDVDFLANFQPAELAHKRTSLFSFHNMVIGKILPRNYICLFAVMLAGLMFSLFRAFMDKDPRQLIISVMSFSVILMYAVSAVGDGWDNVKHLYVVNLLSWVVYGYLILLYFVSGLSAVRKVCKHKPFASCKTL